MNLVKVKQPAMMVVRRVATQMEDADAFSDEISVMVDRVDRVDRVDNASRVMVKMRKAMATEMAMATRKTEQMEMIVAHGIVASDHAIDQTKIEAVIK